MFFGYKRFLICKRYEKDIWGYLTAKHKTVNFGRTKVRPNVEDVPHLNKKKRLLQDFAKYHMPKDRWLLNFSFEIVRRMKKRRKKPMKNWMRFFFLSKILWMFYGDLNKKKFLHFCNFCLSKTKTSMFYFIQIFEHRLPMVIFRAGFAPSYHTALQWVKHKKVFLNYKINSNPWRPISLYDFISFDFKIRGQIKKNLIRLLFYGTKAVKRWRCFSFWKFGINKVARAHFITFSDYFVFNPWNFSLYWWKPTTPDKFKFYFSVKISNILKYTTI